MALDDIPPMTVRCATTTHRITDANCPHCRIAQLERELKLIAPTGRYNGRNIEEWAAHGAQLEAALRYWMPDETMVTQEHYFAWDKHIKLLQGSSVETKVPLHADQCAYVERGEPCDCGYPHALNRSAKP